MPELEPLQFTPAEPPSVPIHGSAAEIHARGTPRNQWHACYEANVSTIFWSWQSDLDARVTRDLIRGALALAIEDLHAELDERHELTSDTQGAPGSPDIVSTILAKIDAATVFVGDVTPIAVAASAKAVANPNVLIELGYAKKSLGLSRVIMVWNTAFDGATIERLPFDMRGRRAPMSYHLPVDAPKAELRAARDVLRKQLREALAASIAAATPAPTSPASPEWQPSSTSSPALWFDASKPLIINEDGEPGHKSIHPAPHHYVRILPRQWVAPAEFGQGRSGHPEILGPTSGFSWGTTRGGFITYTGSLRGGAADRPLFNVVMQFRSTGEVWGVSPFISGNEAEGRFYADAFISHAHDFIESNIEYLLKQGARGPFDVRMGATDLGGLQWMTQTRWGGRPVALEEQVEAAFTIAANSEEERLAALEPAWGEIAAAFGVAQPPRPILVSQIGGR